MDKTSLASLPVEGHKYKKHHKGRYAAVLLVSTALAIGSIPGGANAVSAAPEVPEITTFTEDKPMTPAELLGLPPLPPQAAIEDPAFRTSGATQTAHTIDVAVVAPADKATSTSFIDDAGTRKLTSDLENYWSTQSNNQVTSITQSATVSRYASANTCAMKNELWKEAAAKFGHTTSYYIANTSHHLVVMTPANCGSAGLGSLGSYYNPVSTANGGVILLSISSVYSNLDTLAHEFGHNFGLKHSNAHVCSNVNVIEGVYDSATGGYSDGCADVEYGDRYDVMGAAVTVSLPTGTINNVRPNTMNVNQKNRLGVLGAGEMKTITMPTNVTSSRTTSVLNSTGTGSGLRGLKVTDPLTGQEYFVDFRGGGGLESGSIYETGYLKAVKMAAAPGVRVTTTRDDGTSVVLMTPDASTADGHKEYLKPGESLSSRSGGVTVRYKTLANGTATVDVVLATVQAPAAAVTRIAGQDRYSTSAAISAASFAPGVDTVYITSGENFPDALSAAPVAGKTGSPVLLVNPTGVPTPIQAELSRLKPGRIIILGGPNSVSYGVADALRTHTSNVTRISGQDRYSTSAAISAASFAPGVGTVYITSGENFPDALSAAPVGGMNGSPVLLVNPTGIPASIQAELSRLKPGRIIVLGGPNSVSYAVADALRSHTSNVTRVSGPDRYSTSAAISAASFAPGVSTVYITSGENFPDALSAAPVAGMNDSPVLLVNPTGIPTYIQAELNRLNPTRIIVLGGPNSVSAAVAQQLNSYLS